MELLGNEHTAGAVMELASDFYERCGKFTVRVRKEVSPHVSNRLQAALWREVAWFVAEGVTSVEDVDKAVTTDTGLRWSVIGPHLLFSLASGGLDIEGFCERYRDSFYTWWERLDAPMLEPETVRLLADRIAEEEPGRSFEQPGAKRDAKLVAAIRALRDAGA